MSPNPSRRLRVLVVDDDEAGRSAIVRAVSAMDHDCRAAADGEEAWAILSAPGRRVDVVISDWQMPGLSGVDLCRRVRAAKNDDAYTYFILMTAFDGTGRPREGMEAGADDFQRKPVDLDELEARLIAAGRVVALHERLSRRTRSLRRDSQRFFVAARTDSLTGLENRLSMNEAIAAAISRNARYGHLCSLAICDIDRFKQFNDSFGHVAGDDALRRVAATLRDHLRSSDAIYRFGGEEFVVLLPEQSAPDAALALERLRSSVEALRILAPSGFVTISAGIAELHPAVDHSAAEWLARADAALYDAKREGRNRVSFVPPRPAA